jgi:hypothetical protein
MFVHQVGIAGFFYMGEEKDMALSRLLIYQTAPEPLTRDFVLVANFAHLKINSPENGFQVGGNLSFEASRMAVLVSILTYGPELRQLQYSALQH